MSENGTQNRRNKKDGETRFQIRIPDEVFNSIPEVDISGSTNAEVGKLVGEAKAQGVDVGEYLDKHVVAPVHITRSDMVADLIAVVFGGEKPQHAAVADALAAVTA